MALFPKDDVRAEHLLRKAELALSRAKEIGIGAFAFYSEELEKETTEIAIIKSSLREAIKKNEIIPYYQPVFSLKDLKPVGVEALARWKHPELGLVSPMKFIPVAEETGLIVELGYCILNQAVRDISFLISEGFIDLFLGVNFSMKQFIEESLPYEIDRVLQAYGFPEENFLLEITESTAMKDPEKTKSILQKMREIGIKTAIDDFGTGYSSMNYLIEFDIDKLKIDKSFIMPMLENKKAESVVKTIIDLSNSVGATSLAEGIESEDILSKLRELGCHEGQGYFFAPPMDFGSLKDFLKRYKI